jgi:hypothetical protein
MTIKVITKTNTQVIWLVEVKLLVYLLYDTKGRLTPRKTNPEKLIILYCKDIRFYGCFAVFERANKKPKSKSIFSVMLIK